VVYGEPFTLSEADTRNRREALQQGIDSIMRHIAALLPPAYRGVYAEDAPPASAPVPAEMPESVPPVAP
jgi:1-acyl-sn-glycerol-3-phosphate acyltransferase